jgi:hypothetical protein
MDGSLFVFDDRPSRPRRVTEPRIPPVHEPEQILTWTSDNVSGLPIVDRLRRACSAEREQLRKFCDTATGRIASRLRVILGTMDGLSQTQIGRMTRLSQPIVRDLQRRYATCGPIGLLEGCYGRAGRRSSLSGQNQDRAVASARGLSVRGLAHELRASKSAVHRLVAKADEVERVIGVGGGYVNPRHYLLVAGFSPRPDALRRQHPLRATYANLFATVSDNDWDLAGCDQVVAYLAEQIDDVQWEGAVHVVADPILAAVAARPEWFGGCDNVSIHTGPAMVIWRFVLTQLVGSRPPGWHTRALHILRSLDDDCRIGRACRKWITKYLTMMEWRANPSPWKSVEFLPVANHQLRRSCGGLSRVLDRARVVRALNRSNSFKIYPIWGQ